MHPTITDFLDSIVHCKKELKKDEYLFQEGDKADHIFIVHSGKIHIGKITPDGRELTLRICTSGEIISEVPLFCQSGVYKVSAFAIEGSSITTIHKNDLESLLKNQPEFSVEFMKLMEIQRQRTQSKLRDLLLHGKKGALYSTLIRLSNSYGVKQKDGIFIDLVLTNQELANFCGMTREMVNRLLNGLKKEGKLSMIGGKILIKDLQYLKDEIHCENCPIEICNIY